MSSKIVVWLLVLAVALAGATLVLMKKQAAPDGERVAPGERVINFDPAALESISIERPGALAETLRRDATGDRWSVRVESARGGSAREFALSPDRIGGFLRLLTQCRAVADAPGALVDDWAKQSTLVRITQRGGPVISARVAVRPLGGQCAAEVVSGESTDAKRRLATISDELGRVLSVSTLAWRDERFIQANLSEANRIELVNMQNPDGKRRIVLGRVQARWRILEPVVAPADAVPVGRLLATVQGLRVLTYFDERAPEPGVTGLSPPAAALAIDLAAPAGEHGRRIEAIFGAAADPSAKSLFAAAAGSLSEGTSIVAVDPTSLADLSFLPDHYVSRVATTVAPADVGRVVLTNSARERPIRLEFKRTIDGWVEVRDAALGGGEVLVDAARTAEIVGIIDFCCKTQATSSKINMPEPAAPTQGPVAPAAASKSTPFDGYTRIGGIELTTAGGDPLDVIEMGRWSVRGLILKSKAITGTADVYRLYDAVPTLLERSLGIDAGAAKGVPVSPKNDAEANK